MTPEVRAHPDDGRIAQRLWLDGGDFGPGVDRWVCVTAPEGRMQLNILEDEDVTDWLPLTSDARPSVAIGRIADAITVGREVGASTAYRELTDYLREQGIGVVE